MEITSILGKMGPYSQNKVEENNNNKNSNNVEAKSQSGTENDKVQLSSQAQELGKAVQSVQNSDEVRSEKVSELKQQIDNGEYDVNPRNIAEGIIQQETDLWE